MHVPVHVPVHVRERPQETMIAYRCARDDGRSATSRWNGSEYGSEYDDLITSLRWRLGFVRTLTGTRTQSRPEHET